MMAAELKAQATQKELKEKIREIENLKL